MDLLSDMNPEDQARLQKMHEMAQLGPEELAKIQQEALAQAQAAYNKLSPEERRKADQEAQRLMEESARSMRELVEEARRIAGEPNEKKASAETSSRPKFCTNCGAPVAGGKFCTNCGSPL